MADIYRPPIKFDPARPRELVPQVVPNILITTLSLIAALPFNNAGAFPERPRQPSQLAVPADTSRGTPKTLYADSVVPIVNLHLRNTPEPKRSVVDTTQDTPKTLFADAIPPIINLHIRNTPDLKRSVVDTSCDTPLTLLTAAVPPFIPIPHLVPQRLWWMPADSTRGTPKTFIADAIVPIVNPQFPPDPDLRRSVVDTSQQTPYTLSSIVGTIVTPSPHLVPSEYRMQYEAKFDFQSSPDFIVPPPPVPVVVQQVGGHGWPKKRIRYLPYYPTATEILAMLEEEERRRREIPQKRLKQLASVVAEKFRDLPQLFAVQDSAAAIKKAGYEPQAAIDLLARIRARIENENAIRAAQAVDEAPPREAFAASTIPEITDDEMMEYFMAFIAYKKRRS